MTNPMSPNHKAEKFQALLTPARAGTLASTTEKYVACQSVSSLRLLTNKTETPQKSSMLDRYIPNRNNIDFDASNAELVKSLDFDQCQNESDKKKVQRVGADIEMLLPKTKRIVNVFQKSDKSVGAELPVHLTQKSSIKASPTKKTRQIADKASRVLDAPEIENDYYLNLLDWGKNNQVAIALQNSVYLWNAETSEINHLFELESDGEIVTSLQWSKTHKNLLSIGTSGNSVQLWDAERSSLIRTFSGHTGRVSSLSWNNSAMDSVFSSGSRDSQILHVRKCFMH